MKSTYDLESDYHDFVNEVIGVVQQHRIHAVQLVQSYTNQMYWDIGELIIKRQNQYGWGKSIVKQLSNDLIHSLGEGISWSPRNLWFMRQLVEEYSKVNQVGSLLENIKQLIFNVPWKHNITILQKVKDPRARIFYLQIIDEQLKQPDDKPSIGILLVPHKDHLEVEYALRTASKPIGVAEYTLSKQLPNELKGKLPSSDDFKFISL